MQKNLKLATLFAAIFAIIVFSSKYFYTPIRDIMSYQGYNSYSQQYKKSLEETKTHAEEETQEEQTSQEEQVSEDFPNTAEMKDFDYESPVTGVDVKSIQRAPSKKIDYSNYTDRVRIEEPEYLDENGLYEALMQAVSDNDLKRAKLLISKGAGINSPDGSTSLAPIFWAISNGNVDMVELLVSKGVKVNTPDEKGLFPIHWIVEQSAKRSDVYQIKKIFDLVLNAHPEELNRQDLVFKETPIMLALSSGNNKAFAYLLDKGANLTVANKENKDAISMALTHNCRTCLQMIKRKELINQSTPLPNFVSSFTAPSDIWLPKSAYKAIANKAKKTETDPNAIVIEGNNISIPVYKEMPQILPLDKSPQGPDIIIRER